jgi:hypothetical protein
MGHVEMPKSITFTHRRYDRLSPGDAHGSIRRCFADPIRHNAASRLIRLVVARLWPNHDASLRARRDGLISLNAAVQR